MEVIDHEPHAWFLLRDGAALLLDVHCSHSAVDYDFGLELNVEEIARYEQAGKPYISKLAADIQYSAPGVLGSRSPYQGRNWSPERRQAVHQAIMAFLKSSRL